MVPVAGGVDAVDLTTGQRRWSSQEGLWPLHATYDRVAVARPDSARKNVLRIKWLAPQDGRVLGELAPIVLPDWVDASAATISAWTPMPTRMKAPIRWHIDWEARFSPAYGMRPPSPLEIKQASGTALVDPASGTIEMLPRQPREDGATLPAGFAPDRQLMYWNFSDHGMAWTSTPRAFRIGRSGLFGYFAQETGGARRLLLRRWGRVDPIADVAISQGAGFAPIVTMNGQHMVLSTQIDKSETYTLHHLANLKEPPVRVPKFEDGWHGAIAVIGPRLYYVVENPRPAGNGGMIVERKLVALDWSKGQVAWRYSLAPRFEEPPRAAGGLPRP